MESIPGQQHRQSQCPDTLVEKKRTVGSRKWKDRVLYIHSDPDFAGAVLLICCAAEFGEEERKKAIISVVKSGGEP